MLGGSGPGLPEPRLTFGSRCLACNYLCACGIPGLRCLFISSATVPRVSYSL